MASSRKVKVKLTGSNSQLLTPTIPSDWVALRNILIGDEFNTPKR